ncbi:MAG: hypothetical protein ACMUHM_01035 [Thermoplasmatota archaeon]
MGETQKIWMILALGAVVLMGFAGLVSAVQEPAGEEKGSENVDESNGISEPKTEGPQGYTEMFGQFELGDDGLEGRYVSFGFEDGILKDYCFVPDEEVIFSSIGSANDLFLEENTRMEGAVFHAELEGLHMMSHNNPTSMVHFTYSGEEWVNVSFELSEGVGFGEVSDGDLPLSGLDKDAWITLGTEDYTIDEGLLEVNLTKGVIVCFFRSPYQTMNSFQESTMRAVSSGNIDGELQVKNAEGSGTESQHFPFQGKVEMQVKGSENGKMLKVEVQSQEKSGKVLMFKVQGQVLGDVEVGKVRIEFDGENAEKSGSLNEVLMGNTTRCKYYIERDGEGCYQAMVYVPGFSTHELTFKTEDGQEDSPFLSIGAMIGILLVFLGIAGIVEYGRRK